MSPQTDLFLAAPDRATEQALPLANTPDLDPGQVLPKTWESPLAILAPAEYRQSPAERSALFVQITLCIVVAALLFSVIAMPKIRSSNAKIDANGALKSTAGGR